MKKILSLVLCLAMLLSLGAMTISAAAGDDAAENVLYANYGEVELDGAKDDSMHLGLNLTNVEGTIDYSVVVGAVWNADSLYIGMAGCGVNTYTRQGIPMNASVVSITCENGYQVSYDWRNRGTPAVEANGFNPLGCGVRSSTAMTFAYTDSGANEATYSGTRLYIEFEIPMEQLSFYEMEDGTLATKVHIYNCDESTDAIKDYPTDTDIIVVLSDYTVLAARDAYGATSNAAAVDVTLDSTFNTGSTGWGAPSWGGTGTNSGDLNRGYYMAYVAAGSTNAFTVKPVRTANGVLKAGVASLLNVDLAFQSFPSSAGPVEAENWGVASNEDNAIDNTYFKPDANGTEKSNPARVVLTTKMNEYGGNGEVLLGYAIYNVGGEFRLYSAEATSASAPYVKLPGIVVGYGQNGKVTGQCTNHDLRLEIGTDYSTRVTLDGAYVGELKTPDVTAYDSVPLKDAATSELTVVATEGTTNVNNGFGIIVKNGLVGEKSADATELLDAMRLDTMIPEVYGHQDTITVVDGKFSVRFISDVSAVLKNYEKIGYDYKIGEEAVQTVDLPAVYESVLGDEKTHNGYLAVYAIRDLEIANAPITITVTPWVITTYDEAKMYGESYTVTYTADADGVLSFE